MKTKIFTRLLLAATMSVLLFSAARAQVPSSYLCSVRNDSLLSSTVYEFDIYVLNTDLANVFEYDLFQAGILVNASIINGGVITASIVSGSSELVAGQQPYSITFNAAQHCIKLAAGGIVPHGSATIISTTSPGTRIARIRLTNTVAFGQFSPNFTFNFTPSPYNTVVTVYNQTPPYFGVNITNPLNHTVLPMTNPILNAPVAPFNITGGGNYCFGDPGTLVGLDGSEAGVQYRLVKNSVPEGANVPGTGTALSFGLQPFGTYTSTAYRKATYLTGTMNGSVDVTQTTVTPGITGLNLVCAGSTGIVYTTEAGKDNYLWSVSAGGSITAGGTTTDNTVTITWHTAGSQSVSVNYTEVGCTAANPTIYPVNVDIQAVPTISGPASPCVGISGNVYVTEASQTNYLWSVSPNGTITAGGGLNDNSVTITWTAAGAETVSVNYANSFGCDATLPFEYAVNVNARPVPTISGNNNLCVSTSGVVYTTEAGMSNYAWTVSAGGTVSSGGSSTDNTVTIIWNTPGPQTVSVNYTDLAGCAAILPYEYPVTVVAEPVPTISGLDAVCEGTTGVVYTTESGKSSYSWSVSAGGTITSGGTSTDNTATVTWSTVGAQSVSVNYSNGVCSAISPVSYDVTVEPRPLPTISGSNFVCALSTGLVYTTQSGKSNYAWTVSAGGTITAGGTSTDNTVTVTWNTAGAQYVEVNYTSGICSAVNPTNYPVTVGGGYSPSIIGDNLPCIGATGVVYTTEAGMTNYSWTVSAGGAVTAGGGATDNTVTVTWNTPGAQTVSVNYDNGSCTSLGATTYNVTVQDNVGTPTDITIFAGTEPACQLTNGTTTTTYATTAANSTGFNWSLSSALAGIIHPTTGVMTWANGFEGTVDIQVTANGCSGPSTQLTRTVNITPTVGTPTAITISAGSDPVCQLTNGTTTTTYATTAANNTGFNWSLSNPAAGTINPATGEMTWANGFSGSVDIQVTASGCNGPSPMVTYPVYITPTVGTPTEITVSAGTEPTCQLTNGTTTTTYTTTASNSTSLTWSTSNALAGSIDPLTGVMTWTDGFTGAVDIQVYADGCNGPSTTVTRTVNVAATVGAPTAITISAGADPVCQLTNGTTTTTYATTATDNTGFNWTLSNPAAGSIGASSGIMTWADGFFGTVDIQVTASGCNGPSSMVSHTVNITPTVGTPTAITIASGTEPVCQLTNGTTTTTYATTATDNTGFNWSLSNPAAGTINPTTGEMTWADGFAGSVDIQVTASGCNGPSAIVSRNVVVTPVVGTPTDITILTGTEPTCQLTNGTTTTTYATTATNSTGFNWSISDIAAGSMNASTGEMSWSNGFFGTVDIQVTANGCSGPSAQVIRTVNIGQTVGIPTAITIAAGSDPVCQLTNGSTTTTYATTATDNTGFNWSLSNPAAGSIGAATGIMTWAEGFSGSVDIQVTANGCNGPSPMVTYPVYITPTVGTPTEITVSAGTEPTCQLTNGTTTTTYATTATNNTGFNWSISNPLAGSINPTTGVMTWTNGFAGSVDIQVTADGCNGPSAQVTRTVIVTPTVGIPTPITISAGTQPTCQLTNGTTTTTYATTATNNTGFEWSISNPLAGSINPATGVMTWANGFFGIVNIQVRALGCNGPSTMIARSVSITKTVGTPTAITVASGVEPSCQLTNGTTTTTYATTATNSTGFNWTISDIAAGSIDLNTGVMTWANGFSGSVDIQVTANGCNGPSAQTVRTVTVNPNPLANTGLNSEICLGESTTIGAAAVPGNSYSWSSVPAGYTSIEANPTVTPLETTTYTLVETVDLTGCTNSNSVVVTVNPNSTITITSATGSDSQALCINTALSDITYSIGGPATGADVTGLPAGVTGAYNAGIFTISGTPTVTGSFNYTVTTTGICPVTTNGTITVNPDATIALSSASGTDAQSLCVNTAITPITYAIGGGGTGAGVTGLPAGVTGSYLAGVFTISGTPSVSGLFNYEVTTTGTCAQTTALGSITVNPDATIALSSASGTDTQSLCVNTAITPITYAIGGGGTGAGVTGLPAGVTGSYLAGVFTISGSPSVTGLFNYEITTTGTCAQTTALGSITVNPDATIALSSASGTDAQSLCVNTAITPITYAIGGGGTGAGVTGLPAGVTGSYLAGVFTISGTPSVSGLFNYEVTTTGTCAQTTALGSITVNPDATIALSSASGTDAQSLCVNTAITPITYAIGGGGTGAGVTGLPAGVTGSYLAGVFTISGSPSVTGLFNYEITTTGTCAQTTALGSITVNPDATIALSSASGTDAQSLCVNNAITPITYAIGGGGTGAGVTGLPAGVTGSYLAGVFTISGTPSVSGLFNYEVTTTGTCAQTTALGSITVNPDATIALSSASGTDAQSLCVNTAITPITYAIGGGGTGAGVTGLPSGVTGSYLAGVFTISGTPSVSGLFNYEVTTTGTCAQTTALGSITVNPDATIALSSASGTDAQSLCVNTAITPITYAIGGGGTGAGVTGLPAGVTGSYLAGVFTISGTPSVSGLFNYEVTTTGTCAQTTALGSITVNPDATIALSSASGTDAQSLCVNTAITPITYAIGGGGTGAGVTGLPAGVTGSYLAGVFTISGTPSVSGLFNYEVTTTGTCVQTAATGSITVNPDATIALSSASGTDAQSLCVNNAITPITYAIGGGGTGAGVTGLPAGVTGSYLAGVFTISGTPSVSGLFNYEVTTTGTCAQTTALGSITVNPDATIALSSASGTDAQSLCVNTAITPITYAIGGGGTGAGVTGLPAGVTGSYLAGVFTISGTPSVSGLFNYEITTTGTCAQTTALGSITVNPDATIALSSASGTDAQSLCVNTAITPITYAIGGGGTGAGVTGLPAGVTGSYLAGVFTISGTPSVSGLFNYEVTTTGTCAQTTALGSITVNPDATIALSSASGTDAQSLCVNTAITPITYAIGGGGTGAGVTGLPAGVTGSYLAGVFTISGTPSVSGLFNYEVTTTGTCAQTTALGSITVNPDATIALSSASGTDTQSLCVNTAITPITYAIGGGGTGAGVTGLPAGVTGSYLAGVFTISGTPSVSGLFNYEVTTTGTCAQTTALGSITVNPDATIALSSASGTDAQSLCVNTAITPITYAIGGGGTGAGVTGLPAGVTGSYLAGVFTISGTPSVSGLFNYEVTTTGTCAQTTALGSITVNPNATIALTSAPGTDVQNLCVNTAITPITYAIGGGGSGATVSGLPTGVTSSYSAGILTISGTPTVTGLFNYTVNTTGTCVQTSAGGTINSNFFAIADFMASNLTPPRNTVVQFTDLSTGTPVSWNWSFDPPSGVSYVNETNSFSQNPQVQFALGGFYSVTLTVNSSECPNILTKTNYIHVGSHGTWAGTISSDWTNNLNWDDAQVPDVLTDVVIPASAAFWPIFRGNLSVGTDFNSLTLEGALSQLTVTHNMTVKLGSVVNNAGHIIVNGIILVPLVTTNPVINITQTTADCGGVVTNDGGDALTGRGICWNTTGSPTTADNFTFQAPGIGEFLSTMTGLVPGTTYYVRAYATNSAGTGYGNEQVFTTAP